MGINVRHSRIWKLRLLIGTRTIWAKPAESKFIAATLRTGVVGVAAKLIVASVNAICTAKLVANSAITGL